MAVTSVVFLMVLFGFAALRVDRHQNAPSLMAAIAQSGNASSDLMTFRFRRESFVYYAGHAIPHCQEWAQLSRRLEESAHPCIITDNDGEREIEQMASGKFSVLTRQPKFLKKGEVVVLTRNAVFKAARMAASLPAEIKR